MKKTLLFVAIIFFAIFTKINAQNINNTEFGSMLEYFNATDNPSLTCIEVDDVVWSDDNMDNIDDVASFSIDCPDCANSISELHSDDKINIYPNPTIGNLYISSVNSIEQIKIEAVKMLPHTETCWWLAASSIVSHEFVDQYKFMNQIADFELLINDPILRRDVAIEMYNSMIGSFKLIDGVPFAIKNRGLQGAYLAGHSFAVQYEEGEGMFFLGTYMPSLGLESFEWADIFDDAGSPINGPVFGSKQYIKTPSFKELTRILTIILDKFKPI